MYTCYFLLNKHNRSNIFKHIIPLVSNYLKNFKDLKIADRKYFYTKNMSLTRIKLVTDSADDKYTANI